MRDLAGANIFPGDMMQKNFGVTRLNRVVFYDYDEICYMTDCNFRTMPDTGDYFDEMSDEPCFSIRDNDVFPETFGSFFFPNPVLREIFLRKHADLVNPAYWRDVQEVLKSGGQSDVYPYTQKQRFGHRYAAANRRAQRNAA